MTEHDAELPEPASVHVVELKVPEPLELKVTVPAGVLVVPGVVLLTVAVQVVAWPTSTVLGVQVTFVEVAIFVTVSVSEPELPAWVESPP